MEVQTKRIKTIWAPIYNKLERGFEIITDEWGKLKRLKKFTRLSMRSVNWPVKLALGGGIALTVTGGSVARAASNVPVEATDTWKHYVGRFDVDFDTADAENDSAFVSAQIEKQLRYQAADKMEAFHRAISIGFYGYPSATLFLVRGAPTNGGLNVKIDSLYGVDGLMPDGEFCYIRDYITPGKDMVAGINPAPMGGAERGRQLVASIVEGAAGAAELRFTTAIANLADNDVIVLANQKKSGAGFGTDYNRGMNGLLHLTRANVVHNINGTTYPDWTAGVNLTLAGDNAARTLDGDMAYRWCQRIKARSKHKVSYVYTTAKVIAQAGAAELDQREYRSTEDTMRLGFEELVLAGGIRCMPMQYCPRGHVFLLADSALKKIAPDEKIRNVITTGDRMGTFKQYTDELSFYTDKIYRANLAVMSRQGIGVVSNVYDG